MILAPGRTDVGGAVQKVAFEPAPGVKHNVRRSLSVLAAPGGVQRPPHEMQLQIMLAWLHALVQVLPMLPLAAAFESARPQSTPPCRPATPKT